MDQHATQPNPWQRVTDAVFDSEHVCWTGTWTETEQSPFSHDIIWRVIEEQGPGLEYWESRRILQAPEAFKQALKSWKQKRFHKKKQRMAEKAPKRPRNSYDSEDDAWILRLFEECHNNSGEVVRRWPPHLRPRKRGSLINRRAHLLKMAAASSDATCTSSTDTTVQDSSSSEVNCLQDTKNEPQQASL